MNTFRSLAVLCAALWLAGCGPKEPARGTVKGQVTLSGKPLPEATIVFENKAVGVSQSATTDSDGKYEFITYNAQGLPAASYKVTVSSGRFMRPGEEIPLVDPKAAKKAPATKPPTPIPSKYAKAETSGLSAEVKAGDNPPFNFDLKP